MLSRKNIINIVYATFAIRHVLHKAQKLNGIAMASEFSRARTSYLFSRKIPHKLSFSVYVAHTVQEHSSCNNNAITISVAWAACVIFHAIFSRSFCVFHSIFVVVGGAFSCQSPLFDIGK